MNDLSGVARLANRYRVMRHGQSKANEAGVIVSRIESDQRGDWGLSELGRRRKAPACPRRR
jgi:broad specificity phosphatase PhoE